MNRFCLEGHIDAGGSLTLPANLGERCIYLVGGGLAIAERALEPTDMAVLEDGSDVVLSAGPEGADVMLGGGAPLDGPRHLNWNFVSSSRERIEEARTDWQEGRFAKVPGDEEEFIPLPG